MDYGDQLRPGRWDDFIGQSEIKRTLNIRITAAVNERRMVEHVLLAAPPGYGKTTLAALIAHEMGEMMQTLKMPVKPKVLTSTLMCWPDGGVLFLDEIHAAPKSQQEDLLSLLEDGWLQGTDGRRVEHRYLTIVGATTEPQKLIQPLRDRFPIKPHFVDYTEADMRQIVLGMGERINIEFTTATADALGRAAGTTPRVAKSLVLAARDLADAKEKVTVDSILSLAGFDKDGLSHEHIDYLEALKRLGGTAGVEKLTRMLRMHPSVLGELERLLVIRDMILFTGAGRELTKAGYQRIATATTQAPRTRTNNGPKKVKI